MSSIETAAVAIEKRVVLIKSQRTNNRFYTLVDADSSIHNADIVPEIPENLILGIAYPCLEDGLNDFAVIRTTYETLEYFPDDAAMRKELMEIVDEARTSLIHRLSELRDGIASGRARFLGTDLEEFKSYALDVVDRGYPRRNLDSMMKLTVFTDVAEHEGHTDGHEPLYFYEFRNADDVPRLAQLPADKFVAALFADVLDSVTDDANYVDRYTFDRNVFQKFIALMFINYATTDPIFYGTNKGDYGVSAERDMARTPLYVAVATELGRVEVARQEELVGLEVPVPSQVEHGGKPTERLIQLPGTLVNEDVLVAPIAQLRAAASKLSKKDDRETAELARLILSETSRLIQELKHLNIISPVAFEPGKQEPAPVKKQEDSQG